MSAQNRNRFAGQTPVAPSASARPPAPEAAQNNAKDNADDSIPFFETGPSFEPDPFAGPGDAPADNTPPDSGQPGPSLAEAAAYQARQRHASSTDSTSADYLHNLNDSQRAAVEHLDGPMLVLAGAGTGKTRVLTTRIAHIIATRAAPPWRILAVTFTNKAAREMKERIIALAGDSAEGMPWLGTFHAIGVKILRRHAELAGLKPGFTILDVDDQIRLLKQVMEANELDPKRWPARLLAALIDGWKNRGLIPERVPDGESYSFADGMGRQLYAAYQERLRALNAVDFGDLLLEVLNIFQVYPEVRASYQDKFSYILVDEYQDTNVAQYLWLRLLAQNVPNLCCVGDDDQSIYGWRGAEVENILRFEQDFPGARLIRLEQNYRSTGHILGAAGGLISHNQERLGKTLFTDGETGEKVKVAGYWDEEEEARAIIGEIEQQQLVGAPLEEIAILVRASFQMRAFEDRCIAIGLPYRVVGGPRFYERLEIKDAIAYLSVIANPDNDLRFERILNTPKRALGGKTLEVLHNEARRQNCSLYQAAQRLTAPQLKRLRPQAKNSLTRLLRQFDDWRTRGGITVQFGPGAGDDVTDISAADLPPLIDETGAPAAADRKPSPPRTVMSHVELAQAVLDESGYTAMWQKDKSPQAASRLENLKELVQFMEHFDTLEGFLEHVSLVMDAETGNDGPRISLMTLHAAKGLEFEHVFLPGWEEGLFPHQRSLDENGLAGLEEERRLAYVGLTRAKRLAKVSFAQNRRIHGRWQATLPSRFVDELPAAHAEVETLPGAASSNAVMARAALPRSVPHTPSHAEDEPFGATYQSEYSPGQRVFHQKFGYGRIIQVEGRKLGIEFDKAGRKKVIDDFVMPA